MNLNQFVGIDVRTKIYVISLCYQSFKGFAFGEKKTVNPFTRIDFYLSECHRKRHIWGTTSGGKHSQ